MSDDAAWAPPKNRGMAPRRAAGDFILAAGMTRTLIKKLFHIFLQSYYECS